MDAHTKPKRKPGVTANPKSPPLPRPARPRRARWKRPASSSASTRPINKDTEMHPLVRWQFRGGIEEKDRKAFLFTNVTDCKGRKYDIPVLVGGLAANREIYRIGVGCEFDEIDARWVAGRAEPAPAAASSATRRATRSSSPARTSTSRARASTACRCRSRRRAGTSRPTPRCRSTSPRTPTPACRTWATTAAR